MLGAAVDQVRERLGGSKPKFTFTGTEKPPMILFIWGFKRVLPVNINSMQITETEFSTTLAATRASVTVNLTVIEGRNGPYRYSRLMQEAMSIRNLTTGRAITQVIIPG
jgi:hypothetical protein